MGEPWQRPTGQFLTATPQAHPHDTHEDENSVEAETAHTHVDPRKRKSPAVSISVSSKKIKSDGGLDDRFQSSTSWQLPTEVWQHAFTFLPPKMLGRLLSVNKHFNSLLNLSSSYSCNDGPSLVTSSLSILKPEVIWQLSRRRFWSTMPTPLRGHTELQMWQLACQSGCQFHSATNKHLSSVKAPSDNEDEHASPRPIWAFSLRSCVPCLVDRTIKEVDLLLSTSIPACLIPALPFIFISQDMRVIPSAMLQAGHAAKLPVAKVFLPSHVAAIQEEFTSVRAMGSATAEEWLKGLEGRGKERRIDALRWEKFEISGGLVRIRRFLSSDSTLINGKTNESKKASRLPTVSSIEKPWVPIEQPAPDTNSRESSCAQVVTEHIISPQANISRSKTREEAEGMKAARRVEIERRASELEPPIPAQTLALMPSFQAAIQITSPFDDTAWGLLKPRLIAQRKDVEETCPHPPAIPEQDSQILALESKQQVDKTWDDAQGPLRARISVLADQIICDGWGNGRKVNKESSPQFAAEVLLYVRRRFYAEIEEDDAAARASGRRPISDAPNGPYTRKLTLENMKWLFDVKIKPFTEPQRKELFYCHGCEANTKLYGFEGVIQHYAAKHTSCLSLGSVVVHWRAEWPEVPPFHPEPRQIKGQRAGLSKHKSKEMIEPIPQTAQEQPPDLGEVVPYYGQSILHNQYDSVLMQPPYGQNLPLGVPLPEYTHSFHGQPPQHPIHPLSNVNAYQEPSGGLHDAGTYGPLLTADTYVHQDHIPYQNHSVQQLQPPYHTQSPPTYYTRQEVMARNSRELWFSIAPVRELPGPIRIFVVIHHMSTWFRTRFLEEPSLNIFMDGLSNNKEMRPIRNVNGLQCKACCLRLGTATAADRDKQSYSLPQLVKHFHERHVKKSYALGAPVLNWCTDMIYLPDLGILANLGGLENMDNQRFSLIYSALSGTDFGNSQVHPSDFTTAPIHVDHTTPTHSRCVSAAYASGQQARSQHPDIQSLQDKGQGDFKTHNVNNGTIEASLGFTELNSSSTMSKSSRPIAGQDHNNGASTATMTTFNTESSTKVSSDQRPPSSIVSVQSPRRELPKTVEIDDDDEFDLLAGLEAQLDQQAQVP